jgi:hypothetical protein
MRLPGVPRPAKVVIWRSATVDTGVMQGPHGTAVDMHGARAALAEPATKARIVELEPSRRA